MAARDTQASDTDKAKLILGLRSQGVSDAKVLDALEETFGLEHGSLAESRSVLRDYGNMSAATVMFVLERMLANGHGGRLMLSSLGPGFTAAFLTLLA